MRRFSAEYLRRTRTGMWTDGSRAALADLGLDSAGRVLDVGSGTGEFTAVLREETPDGALVVGADRDPDLLARADGPVVRADAHTLPASDGAFDVVACQALLVNLPDPTAVLREFRRVSRGRVAAVEPDNAAVSVDSTVDGEAALARRARELYLDGSGTDVSLGAASGAFERSGLADVTVRRYDFERVVEPPYSEAAVRAATRKASGAGLRERRDVLADGTSPETLDALRESWREMGREAVRQLRDGEYRRRETVPFYVTVGRV
ncbi:MAG: methyltransferase domain-containing protein [Haloarculaceae archaeon]